MVSVDVTHPVYRTQFKGDAALPETIRRRAQRQFQYLARKAERLAERLGFLEEPIGPQDVPLGMRACVRCDLLTLYPETCGFCAAELIRLEVA